jgi:hypothetical protein
VFILEVKKVYLGAAEVTKIYIGDTITYITPEPDNTAPVTSVYPDPSLTYEAGAQFWLEVTEASITYFTTDGTTPTENSTVFREAITLNETTDLKYFSVDTAGNKEAVKTTTININVPTAGGYRYVRVVGHGDQTGIVTRIIELEAVEEGTGANLLAGLLPISGEAANSPNKAPSLTDGIKAQDTANQVYWWIAEGVPDLIYDLGSTKSIAQIRYIGYSPVADPRTTQFILQVSTDNVNWNTVIDYTGNTTNQPEAGFTFNVV